MERDEVVEKATADIKRIRDEANAEIARVRAELEALRQRLPSPSE